MRADFGSAVVYHASLTLKSGKIATGYFTIGGYLDDNGTNPFCSDTGLMKVFREVAQDRRLTGCRKIYYPKYFCLPDENGKPNPEMQLRAVLASDTFSVHFSEIRSAKFLGVERSRSYLPGVDYNGLVTPEVLKMMRYGPFWGSYGLALPDESSCYLLNFNEKYNKAEIERLKAPWEKKLSVYDHSGKKYFDSEGKKDMERAQKDHEAYEKARDEMRKWFEERKVMVVFNWGTC